MEIKKPMAGGWRVATIWTAGLVLVVVGSMALSAYQHRNDPPWSDCSSEDLRLSIDAAAHGNKIACEDIHKTLSAIDH